LYVRQVSVKVTWSQESSRYHKPVCPWLDLQPLIIWHRSHQHSTV